MIPTSSMGNKCAPAKRRARMTKKLQFETNRPGSATQLVRKLHPMGAMEDLIELLEQDGLTHGSLLQLRGCSEVEQEAWKEWKGGNRDRQMEGKRQSLRQPRLSYCTRVKGMFGRTLWTGVYSSTSNMLSEGIERRRLRKTNYVKRYRRPTWWSLMLPFKHNLRS
jgi:hypothetical protein